MDDLSFMYIYKKWKKSVKSDSRQAKELEEQMKESMIVTAILKYLRNIKGCFCWKEHGGIHGTAGIPDIIACVRGRFVAFEVKTPSNDLTDLQRVTIRKINEAGGIAAKVTSVYEVKRIIEKIMEDEAND
ncbi:hypothetical protein FACS18948_3690 [Clostridia bacterium]|nr:hypothetical protein FACS18948_3690 [Clostridia bacterium]